MTLIAIKVCSTILNKCASCGDNKQGWRWKEVPKALRIYGLGDIKFGHMCYILLSAVIMIDLFPDPDIICNYLNCSQGCAAQNKG